MSAASTTDIPVVILAGGMGTRLREETERVPKPLVMIGERPILWHIMKLYSSYGIDDFIVCCGYRGEMIKQFFLSYSHWASDITVDIAKHEVEVHKQAGEPWRVTLVDTGLATMTGGRVRRVREHVGDETFCLTYGDGLSDLDIGVLVDFHREQGTLATLTAVRPPGRFGAMVLEPGQTQVAGFEEKPRGDDPEERAWINGGFFVLEPGALDYIDGDDAVWERGPMEGLARDGQLSAFRHDGFWQPMDTLRDKALLEGLWDGGEAPWKRWT
jgi:glucose-1-phosphate cytidylyltransferase